MSFIHKKKSFYFILINTNYSQTKILLSKKKYIKNNKKRIKKNLKQKF